MARCQICGKGPVTGKNVSHSNRKTNRWFRPNLQKVRVITDEGKVKRMWVCTSCLSAGKVRRYVSKSVEA
ncbi:MULTISPECIES: 50S ribosomal protein L28 [unclassified Thermosipho (in: thermotogales)]|uniref:50S ribosomal protein L28 n=1 Tax=unclassified Thermosipho (in: thermotogales) TaxID=2676525 RepID=UPI000987B514|nr:MULTISPECIES: 50S ribosomal protein L28 [unclassified Thermosipho (in: thermotogales)]MBT1248084.1 50S ribosomal protein L28 [Thermosipho sp. 1244]OOC46675.1 50S ribosomal protein L28 [Thermosipho sp. 1223]